MYSRLSRADAAAERELVLATYAIYGLLMAGALVIGLAFPWLMRIVVGQQFAAAAELLPYLVSPPRSAACTTSAGEATRSVSSSHSPC